MAATQVACGAVAVGQLDAEVVVGARLAIVTRLDVRRAGLATDGDGVVDQPAIRVLGVGGVTRNGRGFDVHAVAVIDVIEMAPEGPVLDSAGDSEVGFGSGGGAGNPTPARDEVAAIRRRQRGTAAGD